MIDAALPGADLVQRGLDDLAQGIESVPALLVQVGAPRLRAAGIEVPPATVDDPEIRLYELLARDDPDGAHSRYNALIRLLVSFERAAEKSSPLVPAPGERRLGIDRGRFTVPDNFDAPLPDEMPDEFER